MKTPPLIPIWLIIVTAAAILAAIMVTAGCASAEPAFDYDWKLTREASVKPWLYVSVQDAEQVCREKVGNISSERILGCATWAPVNCVIYYELGAPRWVIEHEERHCEGWTH